jgi:hypothetical protein
MFPASFQFSTRRAGAVTSWFKNWWPDIILVPAPDIAADKPFERSYEVEDIRTYRKAQA